MYGAFASNVGVPAQMDRRGKPFICGYNGFTKEDGVEMRIRSKINANVVIMRCRRDLKREKQLRNLEFARSHRKKVVKRFNRRAVMAERQDEDNEYLSSLFGTMRFSTQAAKEQEQEQEKKQEPKEEQME